jgi:uncharacterized protein involved in exopolysaccharide biosynthesis
MSRRRQIKWRRWVVIDAVATLGLLAGAGYAVLSPPMFGSDALVLLPPSAKNISAQVRAATSDPVLAGALRAVDPGESPAMLREAIRVKPLTSSILSISAQGTTTAQAEGAANAVASSYVAYVNSRRSPGPRARAQVIEPAVIVTQTPLSHRLLVPGGLGALLGALIGAIGARAFSRRGRPSQVK